ncbi:nucleotidyltransferase domain-containing protein [Gymnodinialimonas sp.]
MIPAIAQRICDTLVTSGSIRAVFLGGSHGTQTADPYSDVDFVIVTDDGATDAVAVLWRAALAPLGDIVLWRDRTVAPTLINAILAPATRIDVLILKPDQLGRHTQDATRALFDPDNFHQTLAATAPPSSLDPKRLAYQFEEFIRILGLLPLVMGREEYINGVTGLMHLRTLLIDLLIAEAHVPYRGGALTLNPRLTPEQRDLLVSLPPLIPTRDGVLEAHRGYASAYLHRARKFADANDIPWPNAFEDATLSHIGQTLGLRIF